MRLITVALLILVLFPGKLCCGEKHKIEFFRPAVPGSVLDCRLSTVNSYSSISVFADPAAPDRVSENTVKATAEGMLKILQVSKNGHATLVEFTFSSFRGEINSRQIEPEWNGVTLIVEMDGAPCRFAFKDSGKKLHPDEIHLLSMIFHPAPENNIADYIGTDQAVAVGDSWDAGIAPFVRLFEMQGIANMPRDKISGTVTLKSLVKIGDFDCHELEEKLNVAGIPGFDFHFSLRLFLPVDNRHSNLQMVRKAYQKIEKKPDGRHFMTSGIKSISLEMKDTMNAVMMPVSTAEP
ncbi:MAG: hypothetical protein JW808_03555 [Victivallales bacterium]|nr:hypothetical protein [Victivallales bacterium]